MAIHRSPMQPLLAGQHFKSQPHWRGKVIFREKAGPFKYLISHEVPGKIADTHTSDPFHVSIPIGGIGRVRTVKVTPAGFRGDGVVPREVVEAVPELMPGFVLHGDPVYNANARSAVLKFRKVKTK